MTISKLIYMPFLTIQLLQSRLTRSSLSTDQPGNILCCFLCQKEEHSVITAFFFVSLHSENRRNLSRMYHCMHQGQ